MAEEHRATLAEHHIVVQLIGHPLPELEGIFQQALEFRLTIV